MITFDTANKEITDLLQKSRLSTLDVERIKEIIPYCDSELRLFFAQCLINADPNESWPLLQKLVNDSDFLVRAEACQSLSENHSKEAFSLLKKICLDDSNEIVRVYAIISLGLILNIQEEGEIQETIRTLTNLKSKDPSLRVQLALCEALYQTSLNKIYLEEIVSNLNNPDYTIRCSALNHLSEVATKDNKEYIKKEVLRLAETENSEAVLSTIEQFIKELR